MKCRRFSLGDLVWSPGIGVTARSGLCVITASLSLLLAACAGTGSQSKATKIETAPAVTVPAVAATPTVQLQAVAAIGPAITSDEDAERARQELDVLPASDSSWLGRRQAILDYYIASATESLDGDRLEDAFATFSRALSLTRFDELADPQKPPPLPALLPLAQRVDRMFSKRGAHAEVVTALMVQKTLQPGNARLAQRYRELSSWLTLQSETMPNMVRGRSRTLSSLMTDPPGTLTADLEQAYRVWPTAEIRDQLVASYRAEAANHFAGGRRDPREFLQSLSASLRRKGVLSGPAFKTARLFLRVSQPAATVAEMKKLEHRSGEESQLMDLLEATLAKPQSGTSEAEHEQLLGLIKIAMMVAQNPEDAEVSLQLCRDIASRAPTLVAAELCTGELAGALERKTLALRSFERARVLAPKDKAIWEKISLLLVDRLSDLVSDERTSELEGALSRIEAFSEQMHQQFPEQTPGLSWAAALSEVGRGYYNAGRIAEAQKFLDRSVAARPNAAALELLGTLLQKRGQAKLAVATLERARAIFTESSQGDPLSKTFFFSRVGRQIADAADQDPDGQRVASDARKLSLRGFEQLIGSQRLPTERLAEAEAERGKLWYQSGERDAALAAFRRAGEAQSADESGRSSGQLFVDILVYLVQRGELELAVDLYHRALAYGRLNESMKVYCSLWIGDLLQRAGQPEDPLAQAFLKSVGGDKWHAVLARWAVGKLTEKELLGRADSAGRQAEANFYLAQAALRRGELPVAESLWRKVLDSNMLGFFEYDMAATYLKRHGAPVAPTLPTTPSKSRPAGSAKPPGSI